MSVIHSFIHLGYFYSASSSSTTTHRRSLHSKDTLSEFHTEAPQATASEGLAQCLYVAGQSRIRTRNTSDERRRIHQWTIVPHNIYRGFWNRLVAICVLQIL